MCLRNDSFNRLYGGMGIGIKAVRATDNPNEFTPDYAYFGVLKHDESAGSYGLGSHLGRPDATMYKDVIDVSKVRYRIGEKYTVTSDHKTKTFNINPDLPLFEYLAGVHLYKQLTGIEPPFLVCLYEGAVAEDCDTIVAKSIKPLYFVTKEDLG